MTGHARRMGHQMPALPTGQARPVGRLAGGVAPAPTTPAHRLPAPPDGCPAGAGPVSGGPYPVEVRLLSAGGENGFAVRAGASHNQAMDPLVAALAQLVRDRWAAERRARAAERARVRVVEGDW